MNSDIEQRLTYLENEIAQIIPTPPNDFVYLDGSQTLLSGVKIFTTLPESSVVPTTNNQLVNKAYVDSATTLSNVLLHGNTANSNIVLNNGGSSVISLLPNTSQITLTDGTTTNTIDKNGYTTKNTTTNSTHYLNFSDNYTTGVGAIQKTAGLSCNPSTNTITATTFIGDVSGSATKASSVDISNSSDNSIYYPLFVDGTGYLKNSTSLTFNPSTSTLTASKFVGNVVGNVTNSVTTTNIALTSDNSAGTYYIPFSKTTSDVSNTLYIDNVNGPLTYDPSSSTLSCGNISVNSIGGNNIGTGTYKIDVSGSRLYQNIYPSLIDTSRNYANGYYALSKNCATLPNPNSSGALAVSTWTTRTSSGIFNAVAWSPELALFVGVGNNVCGSSPDGINWTARTPANSHFWTSVTWASELSLFVAVSSSGTGSRVMTSSTGITWNAATSAQDNTWNSVVWSPELMLFVAVSENGTNRVMTSPTGTGTWTGRTAISGDWTSVAWSAELKLFCAVSTTINNYVMTSPDGINWTARTGATLGLNAVCWSRQLGIFLATSTASNNNVAYSYDGIIWTYITVTEGSWKSVIWVAELGLFIACNNGTGMNYITSPDGINWTTRTGSNLTNLNNICWSPELGIAVACSTSSAVVATSSLSGRPPTAYNVFNSPFNSIDNSGVWTIPNIKMTVSPSIPSTTSIQLTPALVGQTINCSGGINIILPTGAMAGYNYYIANQYGSFTSPNNITISGGGVNFINNSITGYSINKYLSQLICVSGNYWIVS